MEYKETCIELSIEEGIALGMPKDIGKFGNKTIISYEAFADIIIKNRLLNSVRASTTISDEEIKEWEKMNEYLKNLNWQEATKRVQIIDKDFEL